MIVDRLTNRQTRSFLYTPKLCLLGKKYIGEISVVSQRAVLVDIFSYVTYNM